jgi:hypothetical protein
MKFTTLALTLALFTNDASARVRIRRGGKNRPRAIESQR